MNNKMHLPHKANPSRLGEVAISPNTQKPTQSQAKQRNRGVCCPHDKNLGRNLNETEISNLPDKFKWSEVSEEWINIIRTSKKR